MNSTTLPLVDGVKVVVPDSLDLITPYVLQEQQDWFEDEIKFLRRLLRPGERIIDIGANYGVYTLSMAKAVGDTGRVWAFEPASSTADFLAQGIAANGFGQVVLERSALSSAAGSAQLTLNANAELNELVRGCSSGGSTETVPLTTLDDRMAHYDWQDIAVMKIDAEGEEANILKGGQRLFRELSPLVEYEVKAGTDLHLDLVTAFAALGYDSYRLVPGLNLLVPFTTTATPDAYLLNLFCCKPDRAARLEAAGLLLQAPLSESQPAPRPAARHQWRQALASQPYGKALSATWTTTTATGKSTAVEAALALYAMSQDDSLPMRERFHALECSFNALRTICSAEASGLRGLSLARVARDYGARAIAVQGLNHVSSTILQQRRADPAEPFLAASSRFDTTPPGDALGSWILGSALEELERQSAFSSFYTGAAALQRLENICGLGFASAEMQRRLSLLKRRMGKA